MILPFLEQSALYNQHSSNITAYGTNSNQAWQAIGATPIKLLKCPADTGHDVPYNINGVNFARGNYACNAGGIHGPPLAGQVPKTGRNLPMTMAGLVFPPTLPVAGSCALILVPS